MPLLLNELQILGSVVAGRYVHNQMLDFSALHQITPTIEKFPMTTKGITEAVEKLRNGGMRYRGVLIPE